MANTKVLSVNNSNSRFTLRLTLTEGDYSIANNSSPVTYKLELIANTAYNFSQYSIGSSIVLGGTTVHYQARTSSVQYSIADYGTLLLASGSKTFTHNANGSLDLSVSYSIDMASASYTPGALSGTGSFSLTTIPRYASFTAHKVVAKTETSITIEWNADSNCDAVWYSIDDGTSWKTAQWPQYTISGLSAGTNYGIKTRVRRKDSKLTTDSSVLWATTYDYPYCTSSPDFTIGSPLKLEFYNPLGRSITVRGYEKSSKKEIFLGSISASSEDKKRLEGFNDSGSVNKQYASIPNSPKGQYYVEVTYGNSVTTRDKGNTFKIKGTEVPTLNYLMYEDGNPTTANLTGNPMYIIQGKSKVKVIFDAATPTHSAGSISRYNFTFNGVTKTVKSPSEEVVFDNTDTPYNQTLIMTAVDSRGVPSDQGKISVGIIPYATPKLYAHTDYGYIQCQRCDENGVSDRNGKFLFVAVQGRWNALPEGQNTSHLKVICSSADGIVESHDISYQNDPTIDSSNGYISKGNFRGKVEGIELKGTMSYVVTIKCVDSLTSETDNKGMSYKIPTADVNLHLRKGGHGVAIGKYCETADLFEVDYDAQFNKAINGTFIKSKYITINTVTIQSRFSSLNAEGNNRQSIFIFGTANGFYTYGIVAIHDNGTVSYVGNRTDITCKADTATGKITIDFPAEYPLWDYLTFISANTFTIE